MKTHNHIEAVIFDWAGTTVDYGCFAPVQVFTEVFTNAGVTPTPQEVREPMGMLKWDHIRTMLEMPRIKQDWIRLYGCRSETICGRDHRKAPCSRHQDRIHYRLHRHYDGHCRTGSR